MKMFLFDKKWKMFLLLLLSLFYATTVFGIDNPDAPNYVDDFLIQANEYEKKISQGCNTNQDYIHAYAEYENFLDKELNRAYLLLMKHLGKDSQAALKNSQREWIKHRDAEFEFIVLNWSKVNFGSSSIISKGNYRTTIIKDRVIILFQYLKNY